MSEIIPNLLIAIAGLGIATPLLAWILKGLFTRFLDGALLAYKTQLEQQNIEFKARLDADLQRHNFEHQTRFNLYHQRQAEVLLTLYGLLNKAYAEVSILLQKAEQTEEVTLSQEIELRGSVVEALKTTENYFEDNKILIPADVCNSIKWLTTVIASLSHFVSLKSSETHANLVKHFQKTQDQIEASFRTLLSGIEATPTPTGQAPDSAS